MTEPTSETARPLPPLPDIEDPLFAPFWAGTRDHRLLVPHCVSCGAVQWPPRPTCSSCRADEFDWREISGTGTIYTFFIAARAFHPAFADEVPYVTAVVELEGGVRMLGRVVGVAPEAVSIGDPVVPSFQACTPEVTLVQWTAGA